ncbi:MAG: putative toxin-antitoxin system toxin component, PIN family [Anaerolineaceae bacterium]
MLVVLDTNVIVSGLLNGSGKPGKILDLVLEGQIQVAYDDRILAEYEDVLARPEFHFDQADVKAIIKYIELSGICCIAEDLSNIDIVDADDMPFIEVLNSSKADALITGNMRHFFSLAAQGWPIFSPTLFMKKIFL